MNKAESGGMSLQDDLKDGSDDMHPEEQKMIIGMLKYWIATEDL